MAGIEDFSSVTINLTRTPEAAVNFGVAMLLIDHADIPTDLRYRIMTRSTYQALVTGATTHDLWMDDLWGQTLNPDELYLTRWCSAATLAYLVCPNATTVVADWAALAGTAQLKITEGAANEDIVPDFTGDTSMADVCASIQAAMVAKAGITAAYTCQLDILGRVTITSDLSGSGSDTVSIGTPAAGVDLSLPAWLGGATSFFEDGHDIETLAEAMNDVLAVDNTPFIICERGGSIAQKVALSTAVNALDKIYLCVTNALDTKTAGTTDVAYLIHANDDQQTHLEYTEHTADNPDACICGEIMPYTEAKRSFALWPMLELNASGLHLLSGDVIPLTVAEVTFLATKGCDYLVSPRGLEHFATGLAAGGNEMRIMVGKFYCEAKITEEVYAYMLAQDVVTFSDDDILAVQGIMEKWLDEMVARKVLEADYTINMPSAADFTAATKATHIMDLTNVAEADAQISVNQINITLSWAI